MQGYRSLEKSLLWWNENIHMLRNCSYEEIIDKWIDLWDDDEVISLHWLFYIRDRYYGLGERFIFQSVLTWLSDKHPELVIRMLNLNIIEYFGRWDDVIYLIDTKLEDDKLNDVILKKLQLQLIQDESNMIENLDVSLLAKWMPSLTSKKQYKRDVAKYICKKFGISEKEYRTNLSALRSQIGIVEKKISKNQWDDIDINKVSSGARYKYKNAFRKHDVYIVKNKGHDKRVRVYHDSEDPYNDLIEIIMGERYDIIDHIFGYNEEEN